MPKTGWKYTKQRPDRSKMNALRRSNASSKLHRTAPKKNDINMRSSETISRLKMYNNGKAIRNKEGKVVGGSYMMSDRAGDAEITSATGRIQPDRRWFGNTRVVDPTELDRFREEMSTKIADPYSVVLKRKKLPMGLLRDAADLAKKEGGGGAGLLASEPFDKTFGKGGSRRKRVKLDQYLVGRTSVYDDDGGDGKVDGGKGGDESSRATGGGLAETPSRTNDGDDASNYANLLAAAQKSSETYEKVNGRDGIVPWGRDANVEPTSGEGVDYRLQKKDDLFLKGQSKRIWGEFFKVIDCSDVILHVIDARDVPGTRCLTIERHVQNNASHKHLVFVVNKIDLVPNWVAKRWIGELSKARPTVAFHASMTHAFGKGALISLLRQFGKLHADKRQMSVGVVGYPNVGKSSVINTLISKKSCKVAPVPGETKIWQYITLFKNVYLIDCPGVVVDSAGDTETDSVLKGVVRAERLEAPEDFVDAVLGVVKREHVAAQYGLPRDGNESWKDSMELLEMIAKKSGRLRKGGEPCLRSAAVTVLNDFQRGRLPHYVAPLELKEGEGKEPTAVVAVNSRDGKGGVETVEQDLDAIGNDNPGEGRAAATAEEEDNDDIADGHDGGGRENGRRDAKSDADETEHDIDDDDRDESKTKP